MTASYEDRMLRVLDYIHDNPRGDLSLDALADVAAMSRFHWHRVFHGMTGETAAQAVRRIRLHRAACWLVQTEESVAEIATQAGYDTPQSFSRAFRDGFGMTPTRFRFRGDLTAPLLKPDKGSRPMFPVQIETLPAMRLAVLPHTGAYMEVSRVFEQVSTLATSRNLWPHATGMLGLYYDDPNAVPAAELRSHAGLSLGPDAEIASPLEEISLPSRSYGVLTFKGPYAGLRAAYDHLYGTWLPSSGREPAHQPALEIYLNAPQDTAPDNLLTKVCVPLKAETRAKEPA
ncbi:AraC family transcriptional regulator [Dinoroseobacter sp. S124A]|uniref:AraC family transcriptional regulator n=1 Tax=Dinoroseobacter sp. S124A TaxID=3415128 RepID=UPI003C7A0D04